MKLAALYTVWNGLELLQPSIEQIYNEVDFIVIAWQKQSNKGELSQEVEGFVHSFNDSRIHLVEFTPDLTKNTKQNEIDKHQLLVDFAKLLGASHCFFSATDHLYQSSEFNKAKNQCEKGGYDVTFTRMFTYYKRVTWQLDPIEDYFMPFICKLHPNTRVQRQKNYPVRVDPSIQVNTCNKWHLFERSEIMMHHYSMIRQDIKNKFRNAAASIRWKPDQVNRFICEYENAKLGDEISYFKNRKLVKAADWFNLSMLLQNH